MQYLSESARQAACRQANSERLGSLITLAAWHGCALVERADSPYSDSLQAVIDKALGLAIHATELVAADAMQSEGKQAKSIDSARACNLLAEVDALLCTEVI